jgi:hypothetical protein
MIEMPGRSKSDDVFEYEFYFLSTDRTAEGVERFLAAYLPRNHGVHDEYLLPEFADESAARLTFADAKSIAGYLELHPDESYGLYWGSSDASQPYTMAMAFYTIDGNIIFGLAAWTDDPCRVLESLAAGFGAAHGYYTCESRPPDTTAEFLEICRRSRLS